MSATHNIESSQGDGAAEELLDVLAAMAKCLLQQDAAALAKDTHDSDSGTHTKQPSSQASGTRSRGAATLRGRNAPSASPKRRKVVS